MSALCRLSIETFDQELVIPVRRSAFAMDLKDFGDWRRTQWIYSVVEEYGYSYDELHPYFLLQGYVYTRMYSPWPVIKIHVLQDLLRIPEFQSTWFRGYVIEERPQVIRRMLVEC